jgi:hypothetical protein
VGRHERFVVAIRQGGIVAFILWIIAVVLVVLGIIALARREVLYGLVLIVGGFLIGPGGVSLFT